VLKVPIPDDTVQNPLFNIKISDIILARIRGYAKMKIVLWGVVTGLTYYFGNWMWAIIPALYTLSRMFLYRSRNSFINNLIRSIVLLDVVTF
jgi:hypothetical protein